MSVKRAILCLGAESTGTRYMCRQFNLAGFYGKESGNYFDQNFPTREQKIVWHRTYPLDGMNTNVRRWVHVKSMTDRLRQHGFEDIRAVVNTRDWHSIIQSQLRVGHTDNYEESWQRLQRAYPMIFGGLKNAKIPFVVVTYESILLHGKPVLDHMFGMLDIEPPDEIESIKNGNMKYYKGNVS